MIEWLKTAVFYEVFPPSFKDSDADGIGDLPGIIEKLDYIRELGCSALWLNPCFLSPFKDAGYDVEDYYRIAPRYGTNEDARKLFDEAHRRGMHVLLDLVPGHTSVTHPWFLKSCEPEPNEYWGRYVWNDSQDKPLPVGFEYGIAGALRGISDRPGTVATNCFSTQPALNYGFADVTDPEWMMRPEDPEPMKTRKAILDVCVFWRKMGCDGFRVDMASSLVKKDDMNRTANIRLWKAMRAYLDEQVPGTALVSEWGRPAQSLNAGFDMDFFLHFLPCYQALFRAETPFFSRGGKGDAKAFVDFYEETAAKIPEGGLMCMVTGNHDMPRIAWKLDPEELKLAYSFIFALPGAPFLYYGDEIGMRYIENLTSREGAFGRAGSRTPMQWDSSADCGFSSAPQDMLYFPTDPDPARPDAAAQAADPQSVFSTLKRILSVRGTLAAMENTAGIDFVFAEEYRCPLVFVRTPNPPEKRCAGAGTSEGAVLVAVNPSEKEITVTARDFRRDPGLSRFRKTVLSVGAGAFADAGKLVIHPLSAAWISE